MNKPLRVLMVEDSENDAILMIRQLKHDGYDPLYKVVSTADAMLEALKNDPWDIVISDYMLPEFTGLEALKLVHENFPDLPCIVVSGKISDETAVTAMRAGARDYVMKDNLKRLGSAVAREMEEARIRRERNQAEEELQHQEIEIQQLFDALTEGVAMVDENGKIIRTNPAEQQITGLKADEAGGQYYYNYYSGKYIKRIQPDGSPLTIQDMALTKALKEKRVIKDVEAGFVRADGSILWLCASAAPILNSRGKLLGAVRTLTDMTEQKQLRDERERYVRKITEAQEEERKRIARELHDDTAQSLALLVLEIDGLLNHKEEMSPGIASHLEKLRIDSCRTLEEIRRFSHELRPGILDDLGLIAALEQLITENNAREKIIVQFEYNRADERLPSDVELALFRIAQEALSNIRKHSEASHALIALDFNEDGLLLTICDNGRGFDDSEEKTAIENGHLGLIGMKERAHLVNAELDLDSEKGKGVNINIKVKYPDSVSKRNKKLPGNVH